MSVSYRACLAMLLLGFAFGSGFFYGHNYEKNSILKSAIKAFQNREDIDNETNALSSFDVCLALGGVPNQCIQFMRGLDKATSN